MDSNLPPGCNEKNLPGCSDNDARLERLIEEADNIDGYREWIVQDKVTHDFEDWVYEHFWNALKEDFLKLLHPDQAKVAEDGELDGLNVKWSSFLWLILPKERMDILIQAFIEGNRDSYNQWVIDNAPEQDYEEND